MSQRRRKTHASSQKFKQLTLLTSLGSSPPYNSSPKSPSPAKRKRTRKLSSSSSNNVKDSDSDVNAIRFVPETVDEISDENHSPRRPKSSKTLVGAHAIPTRAASDESLDEPLLAPRNRKGKHKVVLDSEDDRRPRKRKLIKGIRPPTPEEDDDDILDAENLLENRLRSRGKMTPFQKNLEKLKMLKGKKRGKLVLESSSSEADGSENSAETLFKGAKPHHSGESDASDDETDSNEEEDANFIVDDDPHGVPPAQLPLAFSLSTHQDLTHHFKIVCQLFVHIAVQPLADRRPFFERVLKEEEYLSVPLQVTRRKLSGIRDSVASSVWRSDFKKALETHPEFTLVRLAFAEPQCDACHLGGRLSTLLGRLSGKPYDEYDFEDVSDEEPSESSEEDEDSDVGDVKQMFHLGRFCAARTQVYHQFSHWEHSLYKSLEREIVMAQDDTHRFVKVAYGIKPPRDLHNADKVMEWLDERRIIDMEWQKVRKMMDSARNLEKGEMDDTFE
ncbi:hypothetical protein L210DRAFT_3391177 [Boletus edulis BED1]|uniref:DUF4211 domain-containing protein n=1 Tax=Boletus edulis BED1 TaxID=1328754 RepID=A0AAD4C465_BOLED|nr:hypothetical protein L210DRAFT_3391177 [Boletus edulis BED1]